MLISENRKQYDALFEHFTSCFMPENFFELTLLHQLTECTWVLLRYIRHQTLAVERQFQQGLAFQVQRKKVQEIRRSGLAANLAQAATEQPNDVAELARLAREMVEDSISDIDDLHDRTPAELEHNCAFVTWHRVH